MSGSRLPPLRPLAGGSAEVTSRPEPELESVEAREIVSSVPNLEVQEREEEPPDADSPLPPWERPPRSEEVEAELKNFCRSGELVYAAIVDGGGKVEHAVCTVGSRPHNETQIGELVGKVFVTAQLLGCEVGESRPQGLSLQGARWSYSLDMIDNDLLLFGIFSSKALPAIVRAAAKKITPALERALEDARIGLEEA